MLGAAVQRKGWVVWGIERDAVAVQKAAARMDTVIQADLADFGRIDEALGAQLFDCLIFSDVLEHMVDPIAVIAHYLRFLRRPVGQVLVWISSRSR